MSPGGSRGSSSGRSHSGLAGLFDRAGRPLLMPYLTGGFPDLEGCRQLLHIYREAGADIIEIGMPFSDPLADGPVIQASSARALAAGVRQKDVFGLARQAASEGQPVVLLAYLNSILAPGPTTFFLRCAEAGVRGVVVPDLPAEEAGDVQQLAGQQGVDLILLAAPTSTDERLALIARQASGFIYCVSRAGVTGERTSLDPALPAFLSRLRAHTQLPLAVGFGVTTAQQAAEVAKVADGVIIGSRLVGMVQRAGGVREASAEIDRFLREVRVALAAAPGKTGAPTR